MAPQAARNILQSNPIKQLTGGLHYEHYPELFPTEHTPTVVTFFGALLIITLPILASLISYIFLLLYMFKLFILKQY